MVAKGNGSAVPAEGTATSAGAGATGTPQPPRGQRVGARAAARVSSSLDRIIHERLRLGIVSALAVNQVLSFNELKQLMQATDGNLSVHARKLEEAGYISCEKTFSGRLPHTEYRLTASGRRALERYLDHMEALIRATRDR
jgi:DNA-binding HxlR family transcriptional regulator